MSIAPYVRAAFANGYAEAGAGAFPIHASAGEWLATAQAWAETHNEHPQILEAVRRAARRRGVWTAMDRRRDALEVKWGHLIRPLLTALIARSLRDIVDAIRTAREDDDEPALLIDRDAAVEAAEAVLRSKLTPQERQRWTVILGDALRDASAEGIVQGQSYLADVAGDPIPSADHAFSDALDTLRGRQFDVGSWLDQQLHGAAFDLGNDLADAVQRGAKYDELVSVTADAVDDKSSATLVLNHMIGTAVTDEAKDVYSQNGTQQLDLLISVGACDECEAAEADNPYDVSDSPDVPLHFNCRCSLAPAA